MEVKEGRVGFEAGEVGKGAEDLEGEKTRRTRNRKTREAGMVAKTWAAGEYWEDWEDGDRWKEAAEAEV